ncbi:hypothetical protein MPER_02613 [Moniliophthora perniciosa FA553]|nr:hypothetical protein MPER_02613 [Moniliophthora perniciosa FA553]
MTPVHARRLSWLKCEVAWDMFDVLWHDPRLNTQAKLDDLIHNLSESINRALYILMIGVAALSPYWKGIQDIIHILRRTGVTQKLLEPLDMLTPDRVFAVRMVLTSFMSEEIAVDALAYVYNQGHFFNIRYPSKLWGDWDPDSEDDEDSVEADDSKSDRTAR